MRKTWFWLFVLWLCTLCPPYAQSETPGRVRAMEQRAAVLIEARNRFVIHVLDGYRIPYRLDNGGMVSAIRVKDVWHPVASITIVPEVERQGDFMVVRGHNLYFQPVGRGTPLHLFSDLKIPVHH
jgi:hypothetical protein